MRPLWRALTVSTAMLWAGTAAASPPRRIVSLNPCLDVILVELVDRGRIAAVSRYARDPHGSTIAPLAATLPITYGTAEEVIALGPDLVLAARQTPAATRAALRRAGLNVALFGVPETVAASVAQVREVARLTRDAARGEAMAARIEAAIAAAAPVPGTPPVPALVFMPGGFASGPGTLMDELMRRAGLANAAARYGLKGSMNVPLEALIADPPALLLSGEAVAGAPGWADRVMLHPALARIAPRMRRANFPERLLFCGGPVIVPAMAALAAARRGAALAAARRGTALAAPRRGATGRAG